MRKPKDRKEIITRKKKQLDGMSEHVRLQNIYYWVRHRFILESEFSEILRYHRKLSKYNWDQDPESIMG